MASAVQRGPDELGHPGVEHDLSAAALAHVQDARDEPARSRDEEPAGLDREPRRPSIGRDRFKERGNLAGEPGRRGRRVAGGEDRKPAAEVERIEALDRTSPQRGDGDGTPDGVAPRVDRPELRPDVEVDPARPQRAVGTAAGLDRGGDLGLGHAELGAARTDRQPGEGLGRDVRIEPVEDVQLRLSRRRGERTQPGRRPPPAIRGRPTGAGARRAAARAAATEIGRASCRPLRA